MTRWHGSMTLEKPIYALIVSQGHKEGQALATSLDRFAVGLADPQAHEPAVICSCACGCGEEIVEGYEYIEFDGQWFSDSTCLMKWLGAEWRVAES